MLLLSNENLIYIGQNYILNKSKNKIGYLKCLKSCSTIPFSIVLLFLLTMYKFITVCKDLLFSRLVTTFAIDHLKTYFLKCVILDLTFIYSQISYCCCKIEHSLLSVYNFVSYLSSVFLFVKVYEQENTEEAVSQTTTGTQEEYHSG